ncbi:hypothetical protein T01_8928 [Trichinella spiralis]|uniref:Uncharacterized protein n=1 Tax=Trichinella spiralis TaxID=6334 RepID=A0A0V1A459_TRISP|nr:hypothetical protein T01_8928 [Trichinella spiralis]
MKQQSTDRALDLTSFLFLEMTMFSLATTPNCNRDGLLYN